MNSLSQSMGFVAYPICNNANANTTPSNTYANKQTNKFKSPLMQTVYGEMQNKQIDKKENKEKTLNERKFKKKKHYLLLAI